MEFLSGYKTYIGTGLLALVGVAEGIGIDVPGIALADNWLTIVLSSLTGAAMRAGVAKGQ